MNNYLLNAIIDKGLLFLLVFTPLAFGGVQDWAAAVMELAAFAILIAWLINLSRKREAVVSDRMLIMLFGIVVALVALQLVPLPHAVLRTLSPSTATIYSLAGVDTPGIRHAISLYPWATQQYLLKLLAYAAVFIVIINHYREREQIDRLVRFIMLTAFSLVVFAFVQKATWNGRIFWLYPVEAREESVRNFMIWGPFVNRNHFAGYLEMVIPLGLALVLFHTAETKSASEGSIATKLAGLLASRRFTRIGLWSIATLIMIGTLFMTLSRGGMIAFACSAGLFFILARMRHGLRKKIGSLAFAGLLLLLVVMVAGWDKIEERFAELGEEHSLRRADVWLDSIKIVKDFPVLGTGFGTFANIYPRYQSHSSTALYDHAHNDYVEMLTDMGLLGFVAFGALAVVFMVSVFRQWLSRHRAYVKAMGAGGIASCFAMVVHAMTDFNLHIPANAMLLTVIAGLTYAIVFNVGKNDTTIHSVK